MAEEPREPHEFQQSYTDENGNFHYFSQSSQTFNGNRQDYQDFAHLFDRTSFEGPLSSVFTQFSSTINHNSQPRYWTKWDYTEQEWQRFDRFDFTRANIHLLILASISLLIYAVPVISCLIIDLSSPSDASGFYVFFLPFMLLLVFLPLLFYVIRHYALRLRRHRARVSQGERRVTIGTVALGDQALWEAGQYVPLQSLFLKLKRVRFIEQPVPRLHFRRKHLEIRQSSWSDSVEIPVPAGHENEARALVQRFEQETIRAQKFQMPAEPR
jgi:hypothetical protein